MLYKKLVICGFSAGGNLAFNTVFRPEPNSGTQRVSAEPDFAGLFYPWFREDFGELVANKGNIPPLFIMNAIDDRLTPVDRCLDFYRTVLGAGAAAELHLCSAGGHGFDLGEGRGASAALWKESFVAWLKDAGFIDVEMTPTYWEQEMIDAAVEQLDPDLKARAKAAEEDGKVVMVFTDGGEGEMVEIPEAEAFDPQKAIFSAKITARKPA